MSTIDLLAFVAFPYLCLAVFVVGHGYRYITDRYAWNSHGSELIEKKTLFFGAYLFHFGILGTLGGHAAGLLIPQTVFDMVGIDTAAHTALAHYAGRVVGSAAFAGVLLLLARRLFIRRIRLMTTVTDFVVLFGLAFVTGVGTYRRFLRGLPRARHHRALDPRHPHPAARPGPDGRGAAPVQAPHPGGLGAAGLFSVHAPGPHLERAAVLHFPAAAPVPAAGGGMTRV